MFKYLLALFIPLMFQGFAEHYPLIDKLEVTKNTITIIPGKHFKERYMFEDFFIEYSDPDIDLRGYDSSILIMPFVFDVLSTIFASSDTYHVDALDDEVFASFQKIKSIWQQLYKDIKWTGSLIPDKEVHHDFDFNSGKIMMTFGGGVDSTYSSIKHLDKEQLLFTLKGHIDASSPGQWEHVQKTIERFKNTFHHEWTGAFSKSPYIIRKDYPWRAKTIGNLRMIGKAIPLLVHYQIPRLLVPSTITWDYPFQYHSPRVDRSVRFGGITVAQDGVPSSRCAKINAIVRNLAKIGITSWPLKVCLMSTFAKNCSHCKKCLMTMNDLYISGVDPNNYGFNTTLEETKKLIVKRLQEFNQSVGDYQIEDQLNLFHFNGALKYVETNGLSNEHAKWFKALFSKQPCIEYIRSLSPQAHFKE